MKKSSMRISLEVNSICPTCDHDNDLRENDFEMDYFWTGQAIKRLNGEREIKEIHNCIKCGSDFSINEFEIE